MTEISINISGYRKMINRFKSSGYDFVGFRGFMPRKNALILRHDVDFSLDCAVKQARVNNELRVSATFFFLVSADQYNLASKEGRAALQIMSEENQKIGLHLDSSLYPGDYSMDAAAEAECDVLRRVSGCDLEAVSFHRPVPDLIGSEGELAGLPHAYEPRFFSEMEYCSDSQGRFYHGPPFERDAFKNGEPMQLLTHPIWWMREEEIEPLDALFEVEQERSDSIRRNLGANCKPFAEYLKQTVG